MENSSPPYQTYTPTISLRWQHNERNGISNHHPHDYLLNPFFRRRSKKTSKLRLTGLCEGNSPVTGEFPAQKASNAENISIWWRHMLKWTTTQEASGSSTTSNTAMRIICSCWLSWVECINLIHRRSMVTSPIRFSKRKSVERNILVGTKNAETVAHTSIVSY